VQINKKHSFTNGITVGALVEHTDWHTRRKRYGIVLEAGFTNGRREHAEVVFFSDTDPSGFSKEIVQALDCVPVDLGET